MAITLVQLEYTSANDKSRGGDESEQLQINVNAGKNNLSRVVGVHKSIVQLLQKLGQRQSGLCYMEDEMMMMMKVDSFVSR